MNRDLAKTNKLSALLKHQAFKDFLPSICIIIALLIAGELCSSGFTKANNVFNIVTRASILSVACIGQAVIMISGNSGIDMSVGSVMSMACLIGPMMTGGSNEGLIIAVLGFIGIGIIIGGINGVCIQIFKIPALVTTLAVSQIVNGLTLGLTRGQPIMTMPDMLLELGMPFLGPIRLMTLVALVIIGIMLFLLHKTDFGRMLYMVGSNRNAARLSGLKVNTIVISSYMIGAIMSGFAGLMLVGYVGSAQLQMADEYTLLSVAAVVIGGTKLTGGRGGLVGGALGAMVLFLLTSILLALGLPDGVRELIQGAILLCVVLINSRESKLRA